MKSDYKVQRMPDGATVNVDPRFNIFPINEIESALTAYGKALENGGIIVDDLANKYRGGNKNDDQAKN